MDVSWLKLSYIKCKLSSITNGKKKPLLWETFRREREKVSFQQEAGRHCAAAAHINDGENKNE